MDSRRGSYVGGAREGDPRRAARRSARDLSSFPTGMMKSECLLLCEVFSDECLMGNGDS